MMDAELKAKWVAALRSGEYQQGRCLLYGSETYCCLGVLACEKNGERGPEGAYGYKNGIDGYSLAELAFPNHKATLEEMNDGGISFPEIASWIEANL